MLSLPLLITAFGALIWLAVAVRYARDILSGRIKPHVFSWIIWTLVTSIATAAQFAEQAGLGSYITLIIAITTGGCAVLSFKHGTKNITRDDGVFFAAALAAIPLWVLTNDPTLSVILVSAIDAAAYYPTFRKSYHAPHEESIALFLGSATSNALALTVLSHYTIATALYPVTLAFAGYVLVLFLWARRRQ